VHVRMRLAWFRFSDYRPGSFTVSETGLSLSRWRVKTSPLLDAYGAVVALRGWS